MGDDGVDEYVGQLMSETYFMMLYSLSPASLKDNFTDEMASEFFKEALAWQEEKGYKVLQ